jgi:hypothetical protein
MFSWIPTASKTVIRTPQMPKSILRLTGIAFFFFLAYTSARCPWNHLTCQDRSLTGIQTGKSDGRGLPWRSNPMLRGVRLGDKYADIVSRLGKGKLLFRSPDYLEQRESRYGWKFPTETLEVGFDEGDKASFLGLFADRQISLFGGGVYLNRDTVRTTRTKLGPPDREEGPEFNESVCSYSLIYYVGASRDQEVRFISILNWDASGLDPSRINADNFASRRITKVIIVWRKS